MAHDDGDRNYTRADPRAAECRRHRADHCTEQDRECQRVSRATVPPRVTVTDAESESDDVYVGKEREE